VKNIFDTNNLFIRCLFVKSVGIKTNNPDYKLWKFLCIDNVYKSLIRNGSINEIILAIDYPVSWRKLYWDRYKESRKGARDKSGIDWQVFFGHMDDLLDEINEHLPFKVIKVQHAEADDVIAVICMERPSQYTIISTDEDYLQLSSQNIKIYNPLKAKYITCDSPRAFIIEKCLLGQKKDDIFNIKTPLDHPMGKRKPAFGKSQLQKIYKMGYEKWLEKNNLSERYTTNKVLMDFTEIPQTIKTRILNTYDSYMLPDPAKMYSFFEKNNYREYIDNFHTIEQKLMTLY
jgi:hypothetical protein